MKCCAKCKQLKDESEFHKKRASRDGLQSYCKLCLIKNSKDDYKNNQRRELFVQRASDKVKESKHIAARIREENGCCVCREKTVCCLDFHHLDPSVKEKGVSYWAGAKSISRMLQEMQRCAVVCANCHRKTHAGFIQLDEKQRCRIPEEFVEKYGLA